MIEQPANLPDDAWKVWLAFYGDRMLDPPYGAVYPRVSSPGQEEGWSLISQLKAELTRAVEDGISILPEHVYWEVHTAEDLWERPALTRLRAAFKDHSFEVVYFMGVDRFAREPFYIDLVMDEAKRADIEVRFILQHFDDTAEGQLLRSVAGYAAKKELYAIKERTNRGKRERVIENGKPYGAGKPPFGYVWATPLSDSRRDRNSACVEDPATAAIVRRIVAEIAAGRGMRAVCADLMRDGVLTPSGKRTWQTGTLTSILRNPAYIGASYANRWKVIKKNGKRHTVPRPREEWVLLKDGVYPKLVEVADWESAQTVRETNKALAARNNKAPDGFLLRGGFARCGTCGGSMSTRRYKWGYTVYICHGGADAHGKKLPLEQRARATLPTANSQALDAAVWDHVKRMLNEKDFLDIELRRLAESDRASIDLRAIDVRMADIDAQLANYTLALGGANDQVRVLITNQMNTLTEQRQSLEVERARVHRRGVAVTRARDHVEQLKLRLGPQLAQALDNMPYLERRRTLLALGVRVTVQARTDKGKWGLPSFTVQASLPVDSDISEFSLSSQSSAGKRVSVVWHFIGGRLAEAG